jgi:hypothetical protein
LKEIEKDLGITGVNMFLLPTQEKRELIIQKNRSKLIEEVRSSSLFKLLLYFLFFACLLKIEKFYLNAL